VNIGCNKLLTDTAKSRLCTKRDKTAWPFDTRRATSENNKQGVLGEGQKPHNIQNCLYLQVEFASVVTTKQT